MWVVELHENVPYIRGGYMLSLYANTATCEKAEKQPNNDYTIPFHSQFSHERARQLQRDYDETAIRPPLSVVTNTSTTVFK